MSSDRPRLRRLFIKQIFGPQSHDIDISLKLDARVTVLHGRNGSGKTIALKLIDALWAGRYWELAFLPLSEVVIELTNDATWKIVPLPNADSPAKSWPAEFRYELHRPGSKLATGTLGGLDAEKLRSVSPESVRRELGAFDLVMLSGGRFWHGLSDTELGTEELVLNQARSVRSLQA